MDNRFLFSECQKSGVGSQSTKREIISNKAKKKNQKKIEDFQKLYKKNRKNK